MFNVFISRTIRSNPFKHLTFDELEITTKSPLYLLDRSLFGTHILYYKGGEACSDVMTLCPHIPALIIIAQPHMKLAIVIQISFVWLHLHVGNVPPCPPGVCTQTPHSWSLIMSAHYAPTPRWGRWLGAFKYSVAGGEKQREWNVDNAMGIWGSQAKLKGIQGDSGSSTGFYFMWLLLGWPSQSQVKQKLRLPRGHLARCIVKYHL